MTTTNHPRQQVFLAMALLGCSLAASAQNLTGTSFYFGAGLSHTDLQENQSNLALAYGTDPDGQFETQGQGLMLVGGIQVDQHLAFEMTYNGLGSVALDNGTSRQKMFDAHMLGISGLLGHSLTDNVELFGRLGMSYWSTTDEGDDVLGSGNGLVYGAGFDVNLYGNRSRSMRIEWQHHAFDDIIFEDADTVSISAMFKF